MSEDKLKALLQQDQNLREAIRREEETGRPQMSSGLNARLMQRVSASGGLAAGGKRHFLPWIVAACVACVMAVFLTLPKETVVEKNTVAKEEPATPVKHKKPKAHKPVTPIVAPQQLVAQETQHPATVEVKKEMAKEVATESKPQVDDTMTVEENVANEAAPVYASLEQADDTDYKVPSRVDDFIAKLAEYNHIHSEPLNCHFTNDSTIQNVAYVFPDNDKIRLFDRLLQVACWYDTKTPGYLLNFSNRQFVFCLEDLHKGLKYLWVAERIGGQRILLFSTHSPKETDVSSVCFQDYREQLKHKGINNLNF